MNKVVLITGCSSGLGYYLCEALNKNGYTVIASARNIEKLKNISASMKLQIDVTDNNSIVNGINKIINRYEKVAIGKDYIFQVKEELDIEAMKKACTYFIGKQFDDKYDKVVRILDEEGWA